MVIYPAIDLYEGQAVRLVKGDYNQKTVYSNDPVSVAKDFKACGASWIHTVDLEGAKEGRTPNFDVVRSIREATGLSVEIGGGIRTADTIRKYADAGIDRVILGTAAVERPEFVKEAAALFPGKVAVGVDLKDGCVATHGWLKTSGYSADAFFRMMQDLGIDTIICTDVSKDGMMQGPNKALYQELSGQFPEINLIASGGVSSIEDVKALKKLGIHGAIIGKAYYTKAIDLKEAIEVAM